MVDTMVDTADKLISRYDSRFSSQFGTSSPLQSKRPLRIFILSDVRLCREGLALLLAQQQDVEVVGSASSTAVIGDIVALKPDVVLLDATAVDGCALARRLCGAMPESKLVAFSARNIATGVRPINLHPPGVAKG